MRSSVPTSPTIFQPHQGKTFSFLGNTVIYKFDPDLSASQGSRLFEFLATATGSVPALHTHPWDEVFYFLAGEVNFQVENQTVQAAPGCVIHLPAGIAHTFQVKSPQAKFLISISNAAALKYIDEMAEAAQAKPISLEDLMAIGRKHGVQPVH